MEDVVICKKCGTQIKSDSKFCPECGLSMLYEKKEDFAAIKIASILLLINGIGNLNAGAIILGFREIIINFIQILAQSVVPSGLPPLVGYMDKLMFLGLYSLIIGILGVLLPYFLWQERKSAGIFAIYLTIITFIVDIYIWNTEKLPDFILRGMTMMLIPEAILTILPLILIIISWNTLK